MAIKKDVFIVKMTQFLLFWNTFAVESVFRQREFADKSIDFQILIKMGTWAFTFAFCLFFFRLWAKKMLRIDKFAEILLLIMIFISCFYAPNIPYSLASAFSLFAIFFLLFLSSFTLTNKQILWPIMLGCTTVATLSIIAYFVVPDFARMKEWVGGAHIIGPRLTGITGAANTIGYISAFCLLALYYFRHYLPKKTPLWFWTFVAINASALLMSNSRTSLIALILSIGMASLIRLNPKILAGFFTIVCLGIIIALNLDYEAVFSMLARSGDASEITTGTGRTAIWAETVKLINQRPLAGWGYASAVYVLPAHSSEIGFSITQAHNAFLQILLTTGFIGLFLFISAFAIKMYYAIKAQDSLNIAFIFFLMLVGITEPIAFGGTATTSTLVLATVLSLRYRSTYEADNPPH